MTWVRIFDTTLRDGEQAPGCSMTTGEKVTVARQLARLGVDVIGAGFPAASPGDQDAVSAVAGAVGTPDGPVVCGLARATPEDIETCNAALSPAARRRIHTFLATSDLHLRHKLGMSGPRALETIAGAVRHARSLAEDVEFSPEDATRSDPGFLREALETAAGAGATTLNIPDTVGYAVPEEYQALIAAMVERFAAHGIVISTHCHDDLGLAVANSLAGVRAGARQVECTVNGIGERAGNAALEEVVMALATRRDRFLVESRVATRELFRASHLVARTVGLRVPPNKAVVGANAFAHESGIHQAGVLQRRATYEIMTPESVGFEGAWLVLGKHSGRHALRLRLEQTGRHLSDEEFTEVFQRFKTMADRKKRVDQHDVEEIVAAVTGSPNGAQSPAWIG